MPAKAGIQFLAKTLGPRFRGDERKTEMIRLSRKMLRPSRQSWEARSHALPSLPDGIAQLLPLSPLSWFCDARSM